MRSLNTSFERVIWLALVVGVWALVATLLLKPDTAQSQDSEQIKQIGIQVEKAGQSFLIAKLGQDYECVICAGAFCSGTNRMQCFRKASLLSW